MWVFGLRRDVVPLPDAARLQAVVRLKDAGLPMDVAPAKDAAPPTDGWGMVAMQGDSSMVKGELQDARLLRQRARRRHRVRHRRGHAGQCSSHTPSSRCKRSNKGKVLTLKIAYPHPSIVNA